MVNPVLEILHIVPKFGLRQIIARGGSLDVELLKLGEVAIEFALVVTPLIAGVCSNPTPKLFGECVIPIPRFCALERGLTLKSALVSCNGTKLTRRCRSG